MIQKIKCFFGYHVYEVVREIHNSFYGSELAVKCYYCGDDRIIRSQ